MQVPKHLLKSEAFQEECVLSVIEILSAHFSQWNHHVSFPDLATIPLILLKKFHVKAPSESLRRPVKRLIDQVNANNWFLILSYNYHDNESTRCQFEVLPKLNSLAAHDQDIWWIRKNARLCCLSKNGNSFNWIDLAYKLVHHVC